LAEGSFDRRFDHRSHNYFCEGAMSQFQKNILYGVAFAIGGLIATIALIWLADAKPIAGTAFADRLRSALGKGN
jgi:hypothetical protein